MIEITETTRGFHLYGEPFECSYGTQVRVYESSAAMAPHVWLALKVRPDMEQAHTVGEASAHLNRTQAIALVARLTAWLDEIPSRWEDE